MLRKIAEPITKFIITVLSAVILCCSVCFCAEQKNICVVMSRDIKQFRLALAGFQKYCEENVLNVKLNEFMYNDADMGTIIKRIEVSRPDYVLTIGDDATELVSGKLGETPIIFCMATEHNKCASPPNTGVLLAVSAEDKLKTVLKVMPHIKSVGVLYSADTLTERNELSAACAAMGLKFVDKRMESEAELLSSLGYVFTRSNCFIMLADPKIYNGQIIKFVILKSIETNVPVVGLTAMYTKFGALMSVENDYTSMGEQVGDIFRDIINNKADLRDIEIQKAKKNTFSINLTIAERLGIKIPRNVLKEANEKF